MELALGGEPIPEPLIHKVVRDATVHQQIQPILCGSALHGIGVQPLLDGVAAYLPSPLDLPPSEVAKRPDVLVIESGEIQLPGDDVRMGNIGLPPGIAYACLAETIVLALEGRYETFTIGRNIQWEKVKEIYRLGLKHGMKLAAISGVNGVYTDADIQRVRELALQTRGTLR